MTKRTLEDVIDGLKNLKKSSHLYNNEPIVTYGDSTFTVDQVIEVLKSDTNDLQKSVLEGLGEMEDED